jgi:hypothetical protein
MKLKTINEIKIGDRIIITIPTVGDYIEEVVFINREHSFVFLKDNCDAIEDLDNIEDQSGIAFTPNKDGYFRVVEVEKIEK